jgi:hypothetical protein
VTDNDRRFPISRFGKFVRHKAALPECPEQIIEQSRLFFRISPQVQPVALAISFFDQSAGCQASGMRVTAGQNIKVDAGHCTRSSRY